MSIAAVVGLVVVLYPTYWTLPDRHKDPLLVAVGVTALTLYAPWAAIAMALLVVAIWIGLHGRSLAWWPAFSAIVAGFVVYKSMASGGPFERGLSLLGFVYAVPRALHVLLDARYRGLQRPGFIELNAYFWFLPLLVVGPIHRLDEHRRSARRRRFDLEQIGLGCERILVGLASVKLLADWVVSARLGSFVDGLDDRRDGLIALLRSVEYGLNLYFSFAGWTAVAIGISATLGYEVAENFRRPFAQPNITMFWQSWHMTLTRWTRDYVFLPIAAQTRRPYVGIVATMFAIALWHEFSGRYLAWAVWHAAGLVIHRAFVAARQGRPTIGPERMRRIVGAALTTTFVFLGFTITRVESVGSAIDEFEAILTGGYL